MDPFDEFEFKPLTDGLGFHKKSTTLKEQIKTSGLMDDHLTSLPSALPNMDEESLNRAPLTFDDVISSLEKAPLRPSMGNKTFLEVTEPLPRAREKQISMEAEVSRIETPRPVQSPFPSQEVFRQPPNKRPPPQFPMPGPATSAAANASVGTRRGASDSPQGRLQPAAASIPAAALDFIVVTALSLIFLAALLTTTKVDLGVVLRGVESEGLTRLSLIMLFLSISLMYMVIARAFYGRTLGEWTFDVQLGKSNEQAETYYPMKVVLRSIVITLTGVIILPLLSLLSGKDLAGKVSGLQLYQQL